MDKCRDTRPALLFGRQLTVRGTRQETVARGEGKPPVALGRVCVDSPLYAKTDGCEPSMQHAMGAAYYEAQRCVGRVPAKDGKGPACKAMCPNTPLERSCQTYCREWHNASLLLWQQPPVASPGCSCTCTAVGG